MGATYTTAVQRDAQRLLRRGSGVDLFDILLGATSGVVLLAIALAYAGRLTLFDTSERARSESAVVDLNVVADPAPLESIMAGVFQNPHDRRFAAGQLFRFLADERGEGRSLANVGAIARIVVRVKAETTGESRDLDVLAERRGSLFSSTEVAALKPHLVVRTHEAFRRSVLWFTLLYVLAFHAVALLWRFRSVNGDRLLLATAHILTGIGFAILVSRPDPLRDSLLFVRYAEVTTAGLAVMAALSMIDFTGSGVVELSYLPLACALLLSLVLVLFGSGPGSSTAKINLGPVQPIEAIRLLLALFLSGYFARRWELLRVRGTTIRDRQLPRWINLPRGEYLLPVFVGVAAALAFFFLQRDLGPALFVCCVFLAIYAVARARTGMAIAGMVLLVLGFYAGYRLHVSATLTERVRMWQSPWDNAVAGGDQVAHAIWALASGGSLGTGLGLGDTRYLPAGHTDLVLAAIGEELGIVGLVVVAVLFAIVAVRGFRVARLAPNDYGFFLAAVLTLFLIVPVLMMASGILGLTPLTGVVTPFLSYGGSAMMANFAALGMLASIHASRRTAYDPEPFRVPIKCVGAALAVCVMALVAVLVRVQVVSADDYVIKPHLGVQGDGGRRFEYNPRLLDIVRQLPRGTVYDRRHVPLATEDSRVVAGAQQTYQQLGISVADACPNAGERCYPLGGRAFHLLGDARNRVNWSASNTSYIERDAEDRLRGFNDHASVVPTTDAAGRSMSTLRRDYRELLPAFRHRHEKDHPAVVALRTQLHDVTTTIDANFQFRASTIIASYAVKAGGKAAAVVIDPDTGELLASVSYPWPGVGDAESSEEIPDALLDRARYGLYPPGSTFKLVTAAAALRQDRSLTKTSYTCVRLPDGRVGAPVKGWGRPIRDDVLDTHPHGTIDMHEGMVHSCNAYFGQLALALGPAPLIETAGKVGISLTPSKDVVRHVAETLPQVGYGQGEVVATPLRMARVAAAAASNGVLRETHWDQMSSASRTDTFLPPDAARLLAGYMRDVVVTGTGRRLRDHPWRIAGKTGTAELTGKPSHSWFVGFAPYGAATKRVAFAIIIENAGYGAASAAPAAGEIVTAAAAAGLIK